jgi:hypothetical protein
MMPNAALFFVGLAVFCLILPSIIHWFTIEASIGLLVFMAFAFILWPWVFGLVDIIAYMASGSQLTSLPWTEGGIRRTMLMLWPMVTAGLALIIGMALS